MKACFYLYLCSFRNRLKKALHKPVTYVYLVIVLLYVLMIPYSFNVLLQNLELNNPQGMTAVFTVFAFWVIPANLVAYAKRKGLVYRSGDIHFLFPSPVSPKRILLYSHLRTLVATFLLNVVLMIAGIYIFKVVWWRMLLYFLFSNIVENLLEGGLMLLLYGNERLKVRGKGLVVKGAYGLTGVLVAMGIYTYIVQGLSLESISWFLNSDMVQMVPVIGWYVAVLHLLFLGPTAVNVAGTVLYAILLAAVLWAALHMRCTGEFYEDAMKFAEDYEELLANRRQGRTDARMGKKRKYGKASITYKGGFAKAIFYRQLLEYKKNKFFIFDINTMVSIIAGVGIAYFLRIEDLGGFRDFLIPAVMAYAIFIFTAYNGKWGKELLNPYTFLIPDSGFRKLWYATLMQHIQAAINGCLFALPGAIVIGMSPLTTVLCIAFYVTLSACKLYSLAVAETLVGNTLGKTGKQLLQMLILGLAIGIPFLGAVAGMLLSGLNLAYILMIVLLLAEVAVLMVIASVRFYRMETVL